MPKISIMIKYKPLLEKVVMDKALPLLGFHVLKSQQQNSNILPWPEFQKSVFSQEVLYLPKISLDC